MSPKRFTLWYSSWNAKSINDAIVSKYSYYVLNISVLAEFFKILIENFPSIVHDVIEGVNPQIIGIAERDLGAGLLERAKTLKGIRNELDKIEIDIPIHILGTGSPVSLLVYTVCGADLYDGLDWCKNVVNPETGNLYHFSQKDLIDCNCKACSLELPYHLQTLWHNLIFYENFTEEMRQAISNGKISEILNKYLPKKIIPQIKEIAGVL